MTAEKKDPKPRATIEGRAEDVTPRPKKKGSPATPARKKGSPSSGAKTADAGTRSAELPPEAAGTTGFQRLAVPVLSGAAGSAATLVVIALAASFDGPPRAWLSQITGAETARRLAHDTQASARADGEILALALAEQAAATATLQSTVETVGGRLEKLEILPQGFAGLVARIDELGELPAQSTALAVRVGAVELRLDGLAQGSAARTETVNSLARAIDEAAKAGTGSTAVSAGLTRTISRLDKAEAELIGLALAVDNLGAAPNLDSRWRATSETRLAALRRDVDEMATRLASERKTAGTARLGVRLAKLKSAITAGHPFVELLRGFEQSSAYPTLAAYSETGVASFEFLNSGLGRLAQDTPPSVQQDGALGRIARWLGGAVKIRRTDDAAPAAGPVAKAHQALESGDVATAVRIISRIEKSDRTEAWLKTAISRVEVDAALAELEAAFGGGVRHFGD